MFCRMLMRGATKTNNVLHWCKICPDRLLVKIQLTVQIITITLILIAVCVYIIVSDTGRLSPLRNARPISTQPTLFTLCSGSNPFDPGTRWIAFTRCLAICDGQCSVSCTIINVCVSEVYPTRAA